MQITNYPKNRFITLRNFARESTLPSSIENFRTNIIIFDDHNTRAISHVNGEDDGIIFWKWGFLCVNPSQDERTIRYWGTCNVDLESVPMTSNQIVYPQRTETLFEYSHQSSVLSIPCRVIIILHTVLTLASCF